MTGDFSENGPGDIHGRTIGTIGGHWRKHTGDNESNPYQGRLCRDINA